MNQSQIIFGLFAIVAIAGGLVALIGLVINGFMRESKHRLEAATPGPMVCGSCGYAIAGLQVFICPECGKDLREVGIVDAKQRGSQKRSLGSQLALWSLIVMLCSPVCLWLGNWIGGSIGNDIALAVVIVGWLAGVIVKSMRAGRSTSV